MSGTFLKIIALLSMTADHVGMMFFPDQLLFRQIGRLAFPIFAYMIAEGCDHTRNMWKYVGRMALAAAVCQVVYYFALGSLYQCVLVSFTLSACLIGVIKLAQSRRSVIWWLLPILGLAGVYFLTEQLPGMLPGTDYAIDYGFFGIMLPVAVFLGRSRGEKLALCAFVLLALAMDSPQIQFYALLALPFLMLYNGKRGRGLGKYFFYLYYPLHLVALYALDCFLK